MIPRLRASGQPLQFHRDLATAIWAKPAFDCLAALPHNLVITRLSTNLNGGFRHYNDRSISAAARLLAQSRQ